MQCIMLHDYNFKDIDTFYVPQIFANNGIYLYYLKLVNL